MFSNQFGMCYENNANGNGFFFFKNVKEKGESWL